MMLALDIAKDASVIRILLVALFVLLAPAALPVFAQITVLEPPTRGQGARRVWSDLKGEVWTPESAADKVVVYRYK